MLDDFGIHNDIAEKLVPATLIFVEGRYDDVGSLPVMASGNQIGSFCIKYYSDRVQFEKCLAASLKNQTGEVTALLMDEKNNMTCVMPLGDVNTLCTATLVAQCGLFTDGMPKKDCLALH